MKKYLLPLGAGVVVFGVATAFAATLGVSSSSLGAGNATVAACTANAKVSYAVATDGTNDVATATVKTYDNATPTPALTTTCNGMQGQVTLTGAGGAVLANLTGTITSSSTDFPVTGTVNAKDVTGVSVVITG